MSFRIWDGYSLTYQDDPVEEFVSMRLAGFTDSKGKLIYESDIVTDSRGKGVVEYRAADMCFFLRCGIEERSLHPSAVTVIGNAFEDPQLL